MIKRFCLYGFLKNLDFSEPFIILFYLSLGLNFFQIGILTAFVNILINLMEIPSGAFADLYGKKTAMLIALISYVMSFALFSIAYSFVQLFPAVICYAAGEAFRTGTHKAIIFDWLKQHNRLNEKTAIYGYTRAWSKYGSACSVIAGSLMVLYIQNYRYVFIFSIIPGLLGVWNMDRYPQDLNRKEAGAFFSFKRIILHTGTVIKKSFLHKPIRHLILQNMSFSGCFSVAENYLQPLLKLQAAALASVLSVRETYGTPICVGFVYFILNIVSAVTSKNAYRFAKKVQSEKKTLIILLSIEGFLLLITSAGLYSKRYFFTIGSYIILFIINNLWVPIHIAQYDNYSNPAEQASILSITSQAKTAAVTVLAPVCGFFADRFGMYSTGIFLSLTVFMSVLYAVKTDTDNN